MVLYKGMYFHPPVLLPSICHQYPNKCNFCRAIRHLVEATWTRGDMDVLMRYFGNTVSPEKGKPTNGEFVARITNIVKLRMKEAA